MGRLGSVVLVFGMISGGRTALAVVMERREMNGRRFASCIVDGIGVCCFGWL